MSETGRGAPERSATADREIVISRVIDAPGSWCSRRSNQGSRFTAGQTI
ncbi:hypothetical protein ABZ470_16485 [Streptosporangium sp. NPDC020072]|uniref:Uncharacterized protein n=1 Tax=Streptosporangium jomthongense TaxID=1193683 RepID=A0ABV8FC35_9ACTN